MSVFKGTPGPWIATDWQVDDGPNPITICKAEKENLPAGRTSIWPDGIVFKQIANCEESGFSDEENIANARLIAAAPDLLEALILLEKRCGPNATDGAIARAAIARATGEA